MTLHIPVPGARLATELCLPDGTGPFPAVVVRTPYDRHRLRAEAQGWAARGFAAITQDVRGRYGSEGDWHPYRGEETDSAATLRWVRQQAWCDGRVVAVGASYGAYCALAAAVGDDAEARPDAVIAAVPALGPAEAAREPSGVERLLGRTGWWAAHGDRPDSDESALGKALARDPLLLEHLPLTSLPDRLGRELPSWPGVWESCRRDELALRGGASELPLLAVGGTRDPFAAETLRLWRGWGGPARLLLGPWGHGLTADPAPEARPGHRLNLGELYVRWARAALGGELGTAVRGTAASGAVALGGSEYWYATGPQDAHLRGAAAEWDFGTRAGLRLLSGDTFTADPRQPVRSDHLDVDPTGPPDRTLLVTPPLPRPLDLFGDAEVRLRAVADTPSADWVVRLVALDPDGRAEPLAFGVVRRADPIGTDSEFTVPLGFLARRAAAGTRLRVEVAGHHFPAHARNPHTGENPVTATRLAASRRTVRMAGSTLLLSAGRGRRVDPVQEMCS